MRAIKKYLGIVWMFMAVVAIGALIRAAAQHINPNGQLDINKPMPWIIIIIIFTPVAFGLGLFGYYALKGKYDKA